VQSKVIISFLLSSIILLSTFIYSEASTEPIVINAYEEDITGDGYRETITLKGLPITKDSSFFQDIWAEIAGVNQSWTISYGGGYHPQLDFVHLTHDQTYNLLFSSKSSDNQYPNYQLHLFKGDKMVALELPQLNYTSGKFEDDFQVSVTISPDGQAKTVTIDPKPYIEADIYTSDGSLSESVSLQVSQPTLKKHYVSKQQGYGLKSTQTFREPIKEKKIGTLETLWYFENGKWIIVQNKWLTE